MYGKVNKAVVDNVNNFNLIKSGRPMPQGKERPLFISPNCNYLSVGRGLAPAGQGKAYSRTEIDRKIPA